MQCKGTENTDLTGIPKRNTGFPQVSQTFIFASPLQTYQARKKGEEFVTTSDFGQYISVTFFPHRFTIADLAEHAQLQ